MSNKLMPEKEWEQLMIEAKAISNNNCSVEASEYPEPSPGVQIQRIKKELEDRLTQYTSQIVEEFYDRTGLSVREINFYRYADLEYGKENKISITGRAVIVPEI